jgi:hypothetical protein
MSFTAAEVKELMDKAKELGLSHIKVEGFEASLTAPKAEPAPAPTVELSDDEIKALVSQPSPFDDLSEEEILYFATPYFDELQAQKEARAQELKEEEALRGKEG